MVPIDTPFTYPQAKGGCSLPFVPPSVAVSKDLGVPNTNTDLGRDGFNFS